MYKYKVEEYRGDNSWSFKYNLSAIEKKILADIIHQVLNKYRSPTQTIPFVKSSIPQLSYLYENLITFFNNNPGEYFLRTSNCSPKDAWYQLYSETPSADEIDESVITLEEIERDICVLKVSDAEQCIMVLCHSERIYYDMEFDETENAIILMPWRKDILLDTETRCFVKNRKLIGFSQYYCDLENGYTSINQIVTMKHLYKVIIDFITEFISNKNFPYLNAVIDIAVSNNIIPTVSSTGSLFQQDDIIFIEINAFQIDTDSCLYTWEQLFEIDEKATDFSPTFLYKQHNQVIEI